MAEITSVSVNSSDDKYKVLKPAYDRFLRESIFRWINCDESEYITYSYEKVPSTNQFLAEEGIGSYQENVSRVHKYDIFRTDALTINFYERFVQEEDFIPDSGEVYWLTPETDLLIVDNVDDGPWTTTTMSFKLYSYGYFTNNPTDAHIAFVMKTEADDLIARRYVRGTGIVMGDVSGAVEGNPRKPSTQMETWFNQIDTDGTALAGYYGNKLITGPATATPILRDEVEYTITINVTSDPGYINRKLWYTVESVDGIYDSTILDDPNELTNWDKNDIAIGHVFQNMQAAPWKVKIFDVEVTRS